MKAKWITTYWDDIKNKSCTRGFNTYEEAVTFQHKIKNKFNRRCEISLKFDSK